MTNRQRNINAGNALCRVCDGTGHGIGGMWCIDCNGTGRAKSALRGQVEGKEPKSDSRAAAIPVDQGGEP